MLHNRQPVPEGVPSVPDGPLYFVGVGGAGMSALAQVLAERGRPVAGSDPGIAPAVRARLEAAGVRVFAEHDAAHLGDAAALIVSDAIPADNPELKLARERGLPVLRRPELLGALMSEGRSIAIAGTHGKTTTTGMVAQVLLKAGLDPTIFLGGDLPAIGGNARVGKGDIVLAEACEAYDGFLYMHPYIAVVTNVEADHLDYHGDEAHVIASFERFGRQVTPDGQMILCWDDAPARRLIDSDGVAAEKTTYGVDGGALRAVDVDLSGPHPTFALVSDGRRIERRVRLGVPGLHNVRNALAAAAVGFRLGVSEDGVMDGLESFTGTGRRFERIAEAGGVLIVDDYAHHPTELRATLAAARAAYPERRLAAVFQPHLPSRTRDLMDEFADALTGADLVYITDIYLAREQPLPGITSGVLAERTAARAPALSVTYVPDRSELPTRLAADVRAGDLVITLGAGNIRDAATGLRDVLEER